jgi:hypothetical protein
MGQYQKQTPAPAECTDKRGDRVIDRETDRPRGRGDEPARSQDDDGTEAA